jgi:hypothetical protein
MMGTTHIKMEDVDRCLICNKNIGFGNDPALCDFSGCHTMYKYECSYNTWAREQANRELSNQQGVE